VTYPDERECERSLSSYPSYVNLVHPDGGKFTSENLALRMLNGSLN